MRAKSFIKTSVNVTETKTDEGAWKKDQSRKIPSVHLEEHLNQNRNHVSLTLCASFSLKPSF